MDIKRNNNGISEFDNIRTVVMSYSDLESTGTKEEEIYFSYLGKTTEISNNEFVKYNTSFFTENKLFVNQLQKDTLVEETKNEVKYLELLEKTIFPTISNNTSSNSPVENYFGSTIINNTTIFTYQDIPEDIRYVYLFDKVFSINDILRKDSDGYKINPNNKYDYYTISFDEESEVKYRKGLFIFLDKINNDLKVNLSYKAWLDDENPLRNLDKTFLKKDEFNKLKGNLPVTKSLTGYNNYVTDIYSGLLLSNSSTVESNVLNIDRDNKNYINWDSYSVYNIGDQVFWEDNYWTSICNNNMNNIPSLSSDWEITDNLTNYYTRQIEVVLESPEKKIDLDNTFGKIYPDKLINIYPNDINYSFYIKLNPGYILTNLVSLVSNNTNVYSDINLTNNNYGIDLIKSQDYSSLITISDINKLLTDNIEEFKIQVKKKTYKLIISLSENTRNKLSNEGEFNKNFQLLLNDKQIIYRSSNDTVIEYSVDEDNNTKVEFIAEDKQNYSAVNFGNSNITPKFSWSFKNDNGELIEILESKEKYNTYNDNETVSIEIPITVDAADNITDGELFYKDNNNEIVVDSNGNPVLDINKDFKISSNYYLLDINNNIVYYDNKYPYLNKQRLLNDYNEVKGCILLKGEFIKISESSRLTNETGISNIQSNNFTVSIYDTLTISKYVSNSMYSINNIKDNFGNIIDSYKINDDGSIVYSIIPSEFDNQDLTIEYIIDIIETSYTVNFINESSKGIISEKQTVTTELLKVENNNFTNTASFKIYFIDEYYNKVEIDNINDSIVLYKRTAGQSDVKLEPEKGEYNITGEGEYYKITINSVNENFDLVIKDK